MRLLTPSKETSGGFVSPKLIQNLGLSSKPTITEWLMELATLYWWSTYGVCKICKGEDKHKT